MNNYFRKWNFMRLLRLALGVFIVFQGIESEMWFFVFAGGFYALMALLNLGCCGTSGCAPTRYKNTQQIEEEIRYEEVK